MLGSFESESRSERVIVALDCEVDKAVAIAYLLAGKAKWLKIGMTLYYAYGTDLVRMLKDRGYKVFLDLKFFDIPHQVKGAAKSAAQTGADMLTMHASGGVPMMKAALEGVKESEAGALATLGITVLTSMDGDTLKQVGIERPLINQVTEMAKLTQEAGISGVVASPQEAASLRELLGPQALIVTPGVRPRGADKGDQSRISTPKAAFDSGASHIVIGRPITDAEDPIAAFENIVAELD